MRVSPLVVVRRHLLAGRGLVLCRTLVQLFRWSCIHVVDHAVDRTRVSRHAPVVDASRGATAVSSASERSEGVSEGKSSIPIQKNSVSLAAVERSACAAAGERTHMRHTPARCRARRTDALTPTGLTSHQRTGHATDPMCLARPPAPKEGHTKKQTLSATWRRNGPRARDPRAGGVAGPTCAPWPRRALHPLTDAHSPGEHPAAHTPGYIERPHPPRCRSRRSTLCIGLGF